MRRTLRAGLIVLASILLLAGPAIACGGGDDSASGGTPGAKKTATPKITVPADAPQIDQENLTFKPDKVTAKVGETVYFLNSESAIHTVNVNGKNISGNMKKGAVVTWKGQTVGEYKITCDYHPQMKATVVVE